MRIIILETEHTIGCVRVVLQHLQLRLALPAFVPR